MERIKDTRPGINPIHVGTGPSVMEQSISSVQPAINKVDESSESLTPENDPGTEQKKE